jgi:hypothetical protein
MEKMAMGEYAASFNLTVAEVRKESIMRKIAQLFILLALMIGTLTSTVTEITAQEIMSDVVMTSGQKVWLFHSGTPDVIKTICMNDIIPVYREVKVGKLYKDEVVGKVKVLYLEGRHYFEAQVVSGTVKIGDVATKDTESCIIIHSK